MKSFLKYVSIITLFLLGLIFSINVYALETSTSSVNISNQANVDIGDLEFYNISFVDNSNTTTQSIGVEGYVSSTSQKNINYRMDLTLYDNLFREIGVYIKYYTATPGIGNSFTHMASTNILRNKSVSDIAYFEVDLAIEEIDDSNITSIYTPSKMNSYKNLDYVIDSYDINVQVNKNNTFDITERITAYFNKSKHGIYRKIPMKNKVVRTNGTTSNNRAVISNVSVNNNYTTSRASGNYIIQIGSEDYLVTGKQEYIIKYTYNIGKDPLKDSDELYMNLIGTEWDTVIGGITFTVTMPDSFDKTKLGFSSGVSGSVNNELINYSVTGNVIKGSYAGILNKNNALTIRCELPEGYFVGAGFKFDYFKLFVLVIPVALAIISIIIWKIYGKDDTVIETVEFYPPEGFNSLEIGFFYKGEAEARDVTSLLIYLANKGYLKISEFEEKALLTKRKNYKLVKLKDYDGTNMNERIFLSGLFENGQNEVTLSDLEYSFYTTKNEILENINNSENKNLLYDKKANSKTWIFAIFAIAIYALITVPPVLSFGQVESLVFALLFPFIGFSVMISGITSSIKSRGRGIPVAIFMLVWGSMFGGMPWLFMVLPCLLIDEFYLLAYIVGIVSVIVILICQKFIPKRTKFGNEMYGKIKGFRNYLLTAEKEKLEALVLENPTYFFDILPYAYVLDVSDKWIKNFESISMEAPSWYDSPNAFDVVVFNSFVSSAMSSANSAMSSTLSSSSSGGGFSGGSSGGGSSGGGSGGGGGGSW